MTAAYASKRDSTRAASPPRPLDLTSTFVQGGGAGRTVEVRVTTDALDAHLLSCEKPRAATATHCDDEEEDDLPVGPSHRAEEDSFERDAGGARVERSFATVEQWRTQQLRREPSVAGSVMSGGTSLSGGTRRFAASEPDLDLENMTDAEIAQHHFRLAQQHLEAAQRLALAASAPPPQPRPSAPQEQATPSISRRDYLDVASSYGYESAVDPDEGKFSPISPASSATSSFAATINDFGQMSLANALHPGLHAGRTRSAQGTTSVSPTPTEALSSRSVRSMRSIEREAALAGLSQFSPPHRPARPPRRATEGAVPATGPLETPGTLAPSLYGGGLPPGLADRNGSRSTRQAATDSPALSSSISAHAGYSTVHSHAGAQPVPSAPAASDGDVLSVYRDDDDDSLAGDFFDAESVFSHVTNSPLPSYGDAAAPPPVPAIPAQYLSASMPTQDAGVQRLPQPSGYARTTSQDDFHGFRPRQAVRADGNPHAIAQPSAPSPLASAPTPSHPVHAVQPQQPHAVPPFTSMQPHSYIIGANGQPIPVYATFPIPTAPARAPLPIHSQPLQFNHSLPYLQTTPSRPTTQQYRPHPSHPALASAPITQNTIPSPSSAYAAAPIRPAIPPPPPVSLSQHPSTVSLSSSTLRAPSYASSEAGDRPHPGGAPSIRSTKSRMASLRAAVQRPHVRFMSPSPEAKSRAASDPGKGGKAAKKKGAGGGGSALKSGWDDDENESEEERERRKKAMSASLAMLL